MTARGDPIQIMIDTTVLRSEYIGVAESEPRRDKETFVFQNSDDALVERLPTATVADACLRLNVAFQFTPPDIRPVIAGSWCCGHALPVRHHGSVDAFLAAFDDARVGDVLVIDNDGRMDEGCIGDLIALEAATAGVSGIVVWGCHRDTSNLVAVDLPVFSLGARAVGPRRSNASSSTQSQPIRVDSVVVNHGDIVVADDDGLLFLSPEQFDRVLPVALEILRTEQAQAYALGNGQTLREQLQFSAYLTLRCANPNYTFRDHVRQMQRAIEV